MKLKTGENIRNYRKKNGLTQEQLAEKLWTSPQTISRWENGTTYPDIETLPMIASFFGITVDALLGCSNKQKEMFCSDLQKSLTSATKEKDVEKTIGILREIRRNLREYQRYWFWAIYRDLWNSQLYKTESVFDEIRLLTDEIFSVCPKGDHYAVIEWMAYMENDENIDNFLDNYSSREDQSKSRLLFGRYKMREELDKIEPLRKFILWFELEHIVTAANDWQEYHCKDAAHFKWFCETQLNYLNAVNCLKPDKKHIVSGGELDLWCEQRIMLGLRYSWALAQLGETANAIDAFENTVSILEKIMSIQDDEFKLGCGSPALKGFSLDCKFHWMEKDGKEYRELCLETDGWCNWIIPTDLLRVVESDVWFEPIVIEDDRFLMLLNRFKKCIIWREIKA